MSKLKKRPRNPQSVALTIIDSGVDATSSNSRTTIRKNTKKDVLSEAYAEAIRSSKCQQPLQTPHVPGKSVINNSEHYNTFTRNPSMALSQPLAYTVQGMNQEHPCPSNQTQQHQKPEESYFPIVGMMFEDFDTLGSYPDAPTNSCSKFTDRCATREWPGRIGSKLGGWRIVYIRRLWLYAAGRSLPRQKEGVEIHFWAATRKSFWENQFRTIVSSLDNFSLGQWNRQVEF